jgi:drug/metabolite transporter (DMT)-like permease
MATPNSAGHNLSSELRAAVAAVAACAFFAAMGASVRAIGLQENSPALAPQQILFFRYAFGFLLLSPMLALNGSASLRTVYPLRHGLRSLFGATGAGCMFAALATLPVAFVTAVSFASPFVTLIFAVLVLGERAGPHRWGAVAAGFVGITVLAGPLEGGADFTVLFAVVAAVFFGFEVGMIKLLSRSERPLTILLYNNLAGAALAGLASAPVWVMPSPEQLPLLAGAGFSVVLGQALFISALRNADASFVAPFSFLTLAFAALYGWVFFAEIPAPRTWAGAAIIVVAGLWLAHREARARRLRTGRPGRR